jgi:hypothetical protein
LLSLVSGGCLFPFDLHRHGLHKLAAWLIAQKITHVSFSGSLLRTWLASLSDDVRFAALRFVQANSEPLYAQDLFAWAQHLQGDWRIGHSYGLFQYPWARNRLRTTISPISRLAVHARPSHPLC